jgi:hypothetical protein
MPKQRLRNTNGATLASCDIANLTLTGAEKALLAQWETILEYAKQTAASERGGGYNSALTYGVYQIITELDTSSINETTGKTVYDNVELHTALNGLKGLVKAYYNAEIAPTLFAYEFVK